MYSLATSRPLILAAMSARRGVRVFGDQPRHSLFLLVYRSLQRS
nr:MAG TPA: hypothetical protein [Caudoviricetes sp.]